MLPVDVRTATTSDSAVRSSMGRWMVCANYESRWYAVPDAGKRTLVNGAARLPTQPIPVAKRTGLVALSPVARSVGGPGIRALWPRRCTANVFVTIAANPSWTVNVAAEDTSMMAAPKSSNRAMRNRRPPSVDLRYQLTTAPVVARHDKRGTSIQPDNPTPPLARPDRITKSDDKRDRQRRRIQPDSQKECRPVKTLPVGISFQGARPVEGQNQSNSEVWSERAAWFPDRERFKRLPARVAGALTSGFSAPINASPGWMPSRRSIPSRA